MTFTYDSELYWDRRSTEAHEANASAQRANARAQEDAAEATWAMANQLEAQKEQAYWHRVVGQKITSNGVEYIEFWQTEEGQAEIAEKKRQKELCRQRKRLWKTVKFCLALSFVGVIVGWYQGHEQHIYKVTDQSQNEIQTDPSSQIEIEDEPLKEITSSKEIYELGEPASANYLPLIKAKVSREQQCWNKYLSARPGMQDWADYNPKLAAKTRQQKCG